MTRHDFDRVDMLDLEGDVAHDRTDEEPSRCDRCGEIDESDIADDCPYCGAEHCPGCGETIHAADGHECEHDGDAPYTVTYGPDQWAVCSSWLGALAAARDLARRHPRHRALIAVHGDNHDYDWDGITPWQRERVWTVVDRAAREVAS